jgi:hypothetical protein
MAYQPWFPAIIWGWRQAALVGHDPTIPHEIVQVPNLTIPGANAQHIDAAGIEAATDQRVMEWFEVRV